MFKPVSPNVNFPELEEEILKFWKKNRIFEKTLEKDAPKGKWTFLDGPPFITGLPHYGSLLSSIPKDLFPRYKTMQGYSVRRVWGWDCHGLPAENKVEMELGLKSKKEIVEKIGVKKFIEKCKVYVKNVSQDWEWYIDHIGRFVDFENAYKTMDTSYMESVMWVFKQMYDKGYVYKGFRVSLYCPHCATPISNFEVAMDVDNYKEVSDPATVYKYKLDNKENTFILAWSTTPWNKIVTPALAVNPKLIYVKVQQGKENYILAKTTLKILSGKYKILKEFKGEKLIGTKFIPHFDYYKIEKNKKAFIIIGGDFVTAKEGTGVVTIAAYGEEDLRAMVKQNIHIEMHVDDDGKIKADVPTFAGMYYLKANKKVNEDLSQRRLIYKDEELMHNVPLCWRCHTRLYYSPQNAWYVDVQILKTRMKKTNELVNWFPNHFKNGRFLKSLENAPDWNISRSRFWGSPVPVWECMCGERYVPGSIRELEKKSGRKITDLHKPDIDDVIIKCAKCGKGVKRVSEVLDSWIEAGSASFGERHFPFDPSTSSGQGEKIEEFYPPDFVGEYTGQIRAWFYVLHVIANALNLRKDGLNILAKNVVVEGVILGTDGRKMSKNYGNYPDPKELIQKYGGDALRLYLLGSPVMKGEDILISEESYKSQIKGTMLILWNSYAFFVMYANAAKWTCDLKPGELSVLDKWILAKLTDLVLKVTAFLEKFDSVGSLKIIEDFITDFSTWYIRRSRARVSLDASVEIRNTALPVMYGVLVCLSKLLAPFVPFITDAIYKNLVGGISVHLENYPKGDKSLLDDSLIQDMDLLREIVRAGHATRKKYNLKVRQPLSSLLFAGFVSKEKKQWEKYEYLLKEELNVREISYSFVSEIVKNKNNIEIYSSVPGIFDKVFLNIELNESLKNEGLARDIVRKIQEERKRLRTELNEKVDIIIEDYPLEFEKYIKIKASVDSIEKGNKFLVIRK